MAAASAGALKPGATPASAAVNLLTKTAHQPSSSSHIVQQKIHKKQPFPQRAAYITKNNEILNNNNIQRTGTVVSLPYTSTSSIIASHQQPQQQTYKTFCNVKQIYTKGPNVSKGWRRLIIKGDIVYVSPNGVALTTIENVKDYLLKAGTCKCGLPCPMRPELFFDFDVQVPNHIVKLLGDDGNPINFSCQHMQDDNIIITRRKITKERIHIQQNNNVVPSQVFTTSIQNCAQPMKTFKQNNTDVILNNNIQNSINVDNKLSNLKLTRSPPWSKSSYTKQINSDIVMNNHERVPPLPQQHVPHQKQVTQNQTTTQGNWRDDNKINRLIKNNSNINLSTSNNNRNKKKPNFRDDPTGYLEQQTAILQNSILSVPSPDIITEQPNLLSQNNQNVTINNSTVQIFNTNPHQMIEINPNGTANFVNQSSPFPVPNNPILIQPNEGEQILQQGNPQPNQIISSIPHSTTFCGQTVTHMPNGVVQIQQQPHQVQTQSQAVSNDITIQQQIQLQQQIQQQNQLIRQTEQQLQQNNSFLIQDQQNVLQNNCAKVISEESPVSSSTTTLNQGTESNRVSPDSVLMKGPVQGGTISTSNDSTSSSTSSSPVDNIHEPSTSFRLGGFVSSETTSKNTITSVLAGRNNALTATTSVNPSGNFNARLHYADNFEENNFSNKNIIQNVIPVSNSMPDIHIQQINRDGNINTTAGNNNQFIMTSNGQLILMSSKPTHQSTGNGQQMIINNNSNASQFSIDNHNMQNNVHIISQPNVLQQSQQSHNQQPTKHTFNNFNNVILASSNTSGNNQNIQSNMINPTQQQTVVLNTIPSGFVLQPNFVDGNHQVIINQNSNGNSSYVQQQIQVSPDGKRRPKKRKNDTSPQSPNTLQVPTQQNQSMLQIATPQYSQQNFQLSPSLPGITIIPNQHHKNGPQQQIIMSHQNGQIIQPINLIGQQLLVPAGLVVTPDTALLQIQNCGPIITQQGMVLRAPSPQNKSFISSNASGQFIMNSNGQVSPIGQIYSTPVGLVVPHTNSGQTYVHQNTTIVQQQTTMVNNNSGKNILEHHQDLANIGHSVSTQTAQNQQVVSSLPPPDTTTHSPRSPERPTSSKSTGSDQLNMAMVQCVSSSEPDSVVSPYAESGPAVDFCEQNNGFNNFQQNKFNANEQKIRRIESSEIIGRKTTVENMHESSSISTNILNHHTSNSVPFCIGNLVWGSIKGYPAWPGKIINPPDDNSPTENDTAWVKWFGRKPNIELIPIKDLKSLSEGLDAHHKAQKDIRKSRKLNAQLENAIQEAMVELDRMSSITTKSKGTSSTNNSGRVTKNRRFGNQQRNKPVKIAPAPPSSAS